MRRNWIKLWSDMISDRRIARLSDHLWRRTVELYLLAGEVNDDGWLPDVESIAWRLREPFERVNSDLETLAAHSIVERRQCPWHIDRKWRVLNFKYLQRTLSQDQYRGPNWRECRELAREWDEYLCQECGKTEEENGRALDVHHIRPYLEFKTYTEANNLDNLISLCRSCHAKAEGRRYRSGQETNH